MSFFVTNVGQNFVKTFLSSYVTGHCCLTTGHYHVRSLWTTKHFQKQQENYYSVLGLKHDCSQDQIRAAYLNLCKKYHPDKSAKNNTSEQQIIDDTARFQKINEAYNCLCKVDTRNQYDLSLNFGLGNNPFIKRPPKGYYYHQPPPMDHSDPYHHRYYYHQSPFSDRATYNHYRHMRETMYQEREGYSKFHREMFGSRFTSFILLTLVITIILEIRVYILWKESLKNKNTIIMDDFNIRQYRPRTNMDDDHE
ncbi:uncharacterized protein LOC113791751 isoform X3 [Dermatophagoides pteronyssinus]|uniref:DnaJ homolog subfamily B member 9-like isoform X2 n=1 Tax=Dermatophagoides pteronyssinus TaxID=6956 RepID=A0A6P6XVR4_DERPT|nr:dnaJ homolog subfamily B member 9-like isoform X2 [Dermatophagoides pteronyssinus]